MPQSPKKEIKKHKYRNKKNKQKRKRKLKHQNHSQAKRIKKEQIETVSLISDDENASNISYSVNDKDNPIYISDDDDDDSNSDIHPDFPPEEKMNLNDVLDLSDKLSKMNLNDEMDLSDNFGNLSIHIGNGNNNNNQRTRRPSPPPNPHDKWNLNPLTKQGMVKANNFCIPTKEMISLVNTINNCNKHVMYADINSKNRALALIITILEIMHKRKQNMNNKMNILLIAPRRHMALAARELLLKIGHFFKINATTLIGGMPSFQCIRNLSKGVKVITGTPGKICSMIRIKPLIFKDLETIAFNGADELMNMSFSSQMNTIIDAFPKQRSYRVVYCESLFRPYSVQAGKKMMRNIDKSIDSIEAESNNIQLIKHMQHVKNTIKGIQHIVKYVRNTRYDPVRKYDALFKILKYHQEDKVIIFFNTIYKKDEVFEYIKRNNEQFMVLSLDGSACNKTRTESIKMFKEVGGMFFVTDLMNDNQFDDVVVINYDVPKFNPIQTYAKRVGSSNVRISYTIVDEYSQDNLNQIISYFDIRISYNEFAGDRRHHRL
eukprot:223230_1